MGNCCGTKRKQYSSSSVEDVKISTNEQKETFSKEKIQDYEMELRNHSFDQLPKFTFNGFITKAKVVSIYDGDTITIVFYYHDSPIKDSFRMYGYDSPELKPLKTLPERKLHVRAGYVARDYLSSLIIDQIVWVSFMKEEKYGRLMGTIYFYHQGQIQPDEKDNINHHMLEKGLGKPYEGGHKSEFTKDELLRIVNMS